MHQLFGGIIASQLMCPRCNYTSTSYESCFDLQLEIKEDITDTLEEMLEGLLHSARVCVCVCVCVEEQKPGVTVPFSP